MHDIDGHKLERRDFLRYMFSSAALPLVTGDTFFDRVNKAFFERSLSFYNIHTGEKLNTVYFSMGHYLVDSISEINHLLRDHRTGEVEQIDVRLLDLLHSLYGTLEPSEPFYIISGYRSPRTNRLMHRYSNGVATGSLHTKGRAADIRLPGVRLSTLRGAAMELGMGGVGFYPNSGFVHVDTGKVKFWQGS